MILQAKSWPVALFVTFLTIENPGSLNNVVICHFQAKVCGQGK